MLFRLCFSNSRRTASRIELDPLPVAFEVEKRFSVLAENEQLFASKYRLILPTEDELRAELDRERELLGDLGQEKV